MTVNKKILINATSLVQGGLFPHILTKFKYFQKHGYNLYIFTGTQIYPITNIADIYTFAQKQKFYKKLHSGKIGKLSFMWFSLVSNIKAILYTKDILNQNFDIIYSTSAVLNLCIFPCVIKIIKPKIKWVTIFDNTVPLFDPGNPIVRILAWIFYKFSLIFLKKADQIYVISQDLYKYLLSKGFDKKQLTVTGNAIETDTLKKAKKLNNTSYDSIFIGRINETKGIFDMLEVLKIITKIHPNFTLAIMGNGDKNTTDKFKNKIKEYKLTKNIIFLGYVTGIRKYQLIKSSKIFIFLSKSKSESFGIALLEAVSCGLPAVTYDLLPYRKIYKNNEIFSFPIGNINLVAQKIINIFDNKQFNNINGKKLLGKYTWENIAKIELNAL